VLVRAIRVHRCPYLCKSYLSYDISIQFNAVQAISELPVRHLTTSPLATRRLTAMRQEWARGVGFVNSRSHPIGRRDVRGVRAVEEYYGTPIDYPPGSKCNFGYIDQQPPTPTRNAEFYAYQIPHLYPVGPAIKLHVVYPMPRQLLMDNPPGGIMVPPFVTHWACCCC
jgi:hypothetical protein